MLRCSIYVILATAIIRSGEQVGNLNGTSMQSCNAGAKARDQSVAIRVISEIEVRFVTFVEHAMIRSILGRLVRDLEGVGES